jgi:hypothetical protein
MSNFASGNDPEERIAERDDQLAEPKRPAQVLQASPSRRFLASAAPPTTKQLMAYTYLFMLAGMAALGTVNIALVTLGGLRGSGGFWKVGGAVAFVAFLFLARPAYGAFQRRINREKKMSVDVGSDGVTVHTMPGVVFSFGDAQLGRWTVAGYGGTAKGTALHLRCGEHRFVLGGRDHRIGTGTPLEAVAVDAVDAWMWASEFDELLSIVGLRSGLELTLDASGGYADDACPGRGHPELATTDDRMCRFD